MDTPTHYRSVYDNIRRFLQFQLTVNVVALVTCTAGAITGFGTALQPVQLLWVNLIMDTLGALALATEKPTPEMLLRKPYGRGDSLINGHMWRNLLCQAVWQLFFTLGILYGSQILGFTDCIPRGQYVAPPGATCLQLSPTGVGNDPAGNYRNTIIYNAFVWAQLFNEINSRKIYNELNPFTGVLTNHIFLGVLGFSAVVQFITVQFAGTLFRTVPLDGEDWGVCLILGFLSLPVGVLVRFVPAFNFLTIWLADKPPPSLTETSESANSAEVGDGLTAEDAVNERRTVWASELPQPPVFGWQVQNIKCEEVDSELASTMQQISALTDQLDSAETQRMESKSRPPPVSVSAEGMAECTEIERNNGVVATASAAAEAQAAAAALEAILRGESYSDTQTPVAQQGRRPRRGSRAVAPLNASVARVEADFV